MSNPDEELEPVAPPISPLDEGQVEASPSDDDQSSVTILQHQSWSGPLPSPAHLQAYEEVYPGLAEEIVQMAKQQAGHRQEMEKTDLVGGQWSALRGQVFGFTIGMTAIVGTVWLISTGHPAYGVTGLLAAIAGLVGVFIVDKKAQGKAAKSDTPPSDKDPGSSGQAP